MRNHIGNMMIEGLDLLGYSCFADGPSLPFTRYDAIERRPGFSNLIKAINEIQPLARTFLGQNSWDHLQRRTVHVILKN